MRITLLSTLSLSFLLTIVACAGNAPDVAHPSSTVAPGSQSPTTGTTGTGGPMSPGDPGSASPSGGNPPTSGAPASPMEGKCKSGDLPPAAKDLQQCLEGCRGQDETVPVGSRCISARASCNAQCNQKFKP